MKNTIISLLLVLPFFALGQQIICKTDSIKWVVVDTIKNGSPCINHDFVYSPEYLPNGFYGCVVYHAEGCHCSANDPCKKAVCRLCGLHIKLAYVVFQSVTPKIVVKSEYQKLIEKNK